MEDKAILKRDMFLLERFSESLETLTLGTQIPGAGDIDYISMSERKKVLCCLMGALPIC
jgi:hypothetical protein